MFKKIKTKYIIQGIFLALTIFIALRHQVEGALTAAPIDKYCPFGAVETLYTFFISGAFVKRTYYATLVVAGAVLVMQFFVGKAFCGFICPFGTIQEWVYKLTGKVWKKRKIRVPEKVDKVLRYFKYFVLALIIYFAWTTSDLFFHSYDPFVALMHFGKEIEDLKWAYIALGAVLIGSLFIEKLWCRYACPLGAIQGIFSKSGLFSLKRNKETCISCELCSVKCPVGLDVHNPEKIKSAECHACMYCVSVCPKSSLVPNIGKKSIKKAVFPMIALGIFIGVIGINTGLGYFQTRAEVAFVNNEGKLDAEEIRGSYTLGIVTEEYSVKAEDLEKETGIPFTKIDSETKLKDIWEEYPVEVNSHDFKQKYGVEIEEEGTFETEHFRAVVNWLINNKSK